jgi:hypothetical protein
MERLESWPGKGFKKLGPIYLKSDQFNSNLIRTSSQSGFPTYQEKIWVMVFCFILVRSCCFQE